MIECLIQVNNSRLDNWYNNYSLLLEAVMEGLDGAFFTMVRVPNLRKKFS